MARLRILTKEEMRTGKYKRTPRQWKSLCVTVLTLIAIEHLAIILYFVVR